MIIKTTTIEEAETVKMFVKDMFEGAVLMEQHVVRLTCIINTLYATPSIPHEEESMAGLLGDLIKSPLIPPETFGF